MILTKILHFYVTPTWFMFKYGQYITIFRLMLSQLQQNPAAEVRWKTKLSKATKTDAQREAPYLHRKTLLSYRRLYALSSSSSAAASSSGSGTWRVVGAGALPNFFQAAITSSLSWPVMRPACPLMQMKRERIPDATIQPPIRRKAW